MAMTSPVAGGLDMLLINLNSRWLHLLCDSLDVSVCEAIILFPQLFPDVFQLPSSGKVN